ncbi:DUF924 family protein [Kiloniella laminariae]|uniref:DUF924 family protein n=1 Tax=Kiloniella laminariae TaxID=454162 RepID=UPI001B7FE058|nr:DUF924 family protein [Kiloniella laminariae]
MIEEVLEFWFAEGMDQRWFVKDPEFDALIRDKLLPLYEQAAAGELESWRRDGRGCLALCILLDQAPRNLFRNDPRSFATDGYALQVARDAVSRGWDESLQEEEKVFLYLPFEHSEELEDQRTSLELFAGIGRASGWYSYAVRHEEIIRRFGRFPHRNAVLGRETTPEEAAFLLEPGSSF